LHADKTDYLAVSFSMTDAIGHQFGPNSLESEDNLFRLDRTIAKLISAIDRTVGMKNTLIVLTADHGVTDSEPYLKSRRMPITPPIDINILTLDLNSALKYKFKLTKNLVNISWPYLYIDHKFLDQHHISLMAVKNFILKKLSQLDNLYAAHAINPTRSFANSWYDRIDMMGYPKRSGDIYLVDAPYQTNEPLGNYTVSHGSPWDYDSYVPLIVAGNGLKSQKIIRAVHPTDIAITLATLVNIKMPSGNIGKVLHEVFEIN
jgi:predicted AlkP superfamily pyrophosphatase or phosphodiesterase